MKILKSLNLVLFAFVIHLSWGNTSKNLIYDVLAYEGVITGQVFGQSDNPLPGTSIIIREINIGTVTNLEGRFQLTNVPEGIHKLEIVYIGSVTEALEVEVKAGEVLDIGIIRLKEEVNELGEVVVTASIEGQQRAYNQQKNSDQIKTIVSADLVNQFPDINVSEALQRVTGVNIERSNGEGTNIRIRGTPNNYTTITIDGAQLPNTNGEERTEALDLIPAELLSTMEITKALLPENDGDAIGGTVNLKTPVATSKKGKLKGSIAGGYASIDERETVRSKLKYSKRFLNKRIGMILGASYYTTVSGEDRIDGIWNNRIESGDSEASERITALAELQTRPSLNVRERIGANATFDYRFSENSKILATGSYYSLVDQGERYRTRYRSRGVFPELGNPLVAGTENGSARIQKDLADQTRRRSNFTFTIGGEHLINNSGKLDYGYNYSNSERDEEAFRSVFVRRGIVFDIDLSNPDFPQYNPRDFNESNAAQYEFLGYQVEKPITVTGTNQTFYANYEQPFKLGNKINSTLKFGGKLRLQENSRRRFNTQYANYQGNFTLDQVAGPDQGSIFEGRYNLGVFPSASRMRRHFEANQDLYTFDADESFLNTESNKYDAQEDIGALYIQDKLSIGKFSAVFGVRYEHTDANYQANIVENNFGELTSTPVEGGLEFDFLLPSLSMKYALGPRTNLRASYFESFARPNFIDLVPTEIINFATLQVRRGNPDLQPAFSRNLDFMFEHYFKKDGTFSVGVYYKSIDNFIFNQQSIITDNPALENFQLLQAVNGDLAEVLGVEITASKKFTFLPGFLNGFGVYANYTYVDSSSSYTGLLSDFDTGETIVATRQDVPFVGQADHTANAALYYDKGKFSIRASLNYQSESLLSFDVDPFFDFILEERYQLDANASYKFNKNLSLFFEAQNLTNAPVIEYLGTRERMSRRLEFGTFARLGLNFKF